MLLSVHIFAGITVAIISKNVYIGSAAALISHAVLDSLPHWNFPVPKKINLFEFFEKFGPDMVASVVIFILILILKPSQWLYICLGAGFASLPDFLTLFIKKQPWRQILRLFYKFHNRIQWEIKMAPGLAIQAFVVLVLVSLLLNYGIRK
jgi:hypothetical protein